MNILRYYLLTDQVMIIVDIWKCPSFRNDQWLYYRVKMRFRDGLTIKAIDQDGSDSIRSYKYDDSRFLSSFTKVSKSELKMLKIKWIH